MTTHEKAIDPDYDHLPIGALQHHLLGLDADRLRLLRCYEAAHADRDAVLTMIDFRLAQLTSGTDRWHPTGDGEYT